MISSLFLRSVPVLGYLGNVIAGEQTYQLDAEYSGATFFEGFDFFDGSDPTYGFVT
jgi:hypothetical protein